jgi:hypothetical protein
VKRIRIAAIVVLAACGGHRAEHSRRGKPICTATSPKGERRSAARRSLLLAELGSPYTPAAQQDSNTGFRCMRTDHASLFGGRRVK